MKILIQFGTSDKKNPFWKGKYFHLTNKWAGNLTFGKKQCKGWRPYSVLISTQHQEEGSSCSFQSEHSEEVSDCLSPLTSVQVLFYWPKPVTSYSNWLQILAVIFVLKIWEQIAGKLSSKKVCKWTQSLNEWRVNSCECRVNAHVFLSKNKRNWCDRRRRRRNCAFVNNLVNHALPVVIEHWSSDDLQETSLGTLYLCLGL